MELARRGYILQNYPEDVLMPGEKRATLTKSKGIHNLSLHERRVFADALKNDLLTIKTITKQGALAHLMASHSPVIVEEVPAPHSAYTRGRRWYANGRFDQQGLPRLKLNHTSLETSPVPSPVPSLAKCPAPGPLSRRRDPASSPAQRPDPGPVSGVRAPVAANTMHCQQRLKVFIEVPLPPPSWRLTVGRSNTKELIPQISCIGQGS